MTIRAIYRSEPSFPATDQHPDARRYRIGAYWVDAVGGEPALDAVETVLGVRPSSQSVKAEARRRILARFPEWKQANMTARGVELQDLWRRNGSWTSGEQAEADALQAAWDWIKAIRAASDALEAMSPIPADYADNRHWPV